MLAAEVRAAIFAKMLGIHIKSAIQWQQLSNGDWTPTLRNQPAGKADVTSQSYGNALPENGIC